MMKCEEYKSLLEDMETRAMYGLIGEEDIDKVIEDMAFDDNITDVQYAELYERAVAITRVTIG